MRLYINLLFVIILFVQCTKVDVPDAQLQLVDSISVANPDSAIQILENLLHQKRSDKKTRILFELGHLNYIQHNYDTSKYYFNRLLKREDASNQDKILSLRHIAYIHTNESKFYEAIHAFNEQLKLSEESNDSTEICGTWIDLAEIYREEKLWNEFDEYINKAKSYAELNSDSANLARLYNMIGAKLSTQKNYSESNAYLKKAISYLTKEQQIYIPYLKQNIAQNHEAQGKTHLAIMNNKELLNLYQTSNDQLRFARVSLNLFDSYAKLNMNDSALYFIRNAYRICDSLNFHNDKLIALNKLIAFYENQESYREALKLKFEHDALKDSLKQSESQFINQQLQENYNKEKQAIRQEAKESRRRILIILIAVLLITILLFLYLQVRKHLKLKSKEKDILLLQKEKTAKELELKRSEIFDFSTRLIEKNRILLDLEQELQLIKKSEVSPSQLNSIRQSLKTHLLNENAQSLIEEKIENANSDFFIQLKAKHPNITSDDIQLIGLLRMKFNTKQISEILNSSERAIESKRYRLRKKLDLQKGINLTEYILNLK